MSAGQDFALPGWWWGTNPPGGRFYAGRVHVVHPDRSRLALCGLPVEDLSQSRPPTPEHLCPDCALAALDAMYPPERELPTVGRDGRDHDRIGGERPDSAEQTLVLPVVGDDGDP